jgi:hypothetical protein
LPWHATWLLAGETTRLRVARLLAVARGRTLLTWLSRLTEAARLLAEPIGLLAIRARLTVRAGLLRRDGHRFLLAGRQL